jgi:hypothetical protein
MVQCIWVEIALKQRGIRVKQNVSHVQIRVGNFANQ